MSEQAVVAESSPAEVADVFRGENVSHAEFSRFRETGEVPERFKPAETADPAPASEGKQPESEPDSDPDEQQEKGKGKRKDQTAEERIAQLESTIEKIKRRAGLERKTEVAPVVQTDSNAPPQNYADYRKQFKPSQWVEQYGKDHPDASYEDATAAMADHLADVRDRFRSWEEQRSSQEQELSEQVAEARAQYGKNFDEVLQPTLTAILSDTRMNPNVKAMINDSDVITDLLYTIGSDPETLDAFISMAATNPGKALRYIATVENGIIEALTEGREADEDGQTTVRQSPAKPKTSAPKPPSPVSRASSGAFDVSDESLSAEEWARKRTADLKRRGK